MKLTLSPQAVAAVTTVLVTTQVQLISRGCFKRVQQAINALAITENGRTSFSGGDIDLDRADWEWLQIAAAAVPAWPGEIVAYDGDEILKKTLTDALKEDTDDGKDPASK